MKAKLTGILVRAFASYAIVSMTGGLLYAFSFMSGFTSPRDASMGWFIILWMGPLAIAVTVGAPLFLLRVWKSREADWLL